MRIGIDVDGVLANFVVSYRRLIVTMTGRNLFQPGDDVNPPVWDWEKLRGYTDEEIKPVWAHIMTSPDFWVHLTALPGATALAQRIARLENDHDLYFVTARVGDGAKWQTEVWLNTMIPVQLPTVLLSKDKGAICKALNIDLYIDDNLPNVQGVVEQSPKTRTYLLDYAYNQEDIVAPQYRRVSSVEEMFRNEGL